MIKPPEFLDDIPGPESKMIWRPGRSDMGKKVVMQGVVMAAQYFRDEQKLVVKVGMNDGSIRYGILIAQELTFHGTPYNMLDRNTIDSEMERTSDLFNRRKGSRIKMEMFEDQVTLQ